MWKTTENPSSFLSNRGSTASGVTSRPVMPVPPVVMMASTKPDAHQASIRSRIAGMLSGTMALSASS